MKVKVPGLIATALASVALTLGGCGGGGGEGSSDTIRFAGYGGKYQENIRKALLDPPASGLGLAIEEDSHDGLPAVRLQVQSGNPAWDLVQLGASDCARGEREGLFEPLDYSKFDLAGLPESARGRSWVGTNYYSVVMAWRTDKFGANPPKTWADFWDVKKYPGRRALSILGNEMLEVALLADGVPRDKLYPLDVDRAIRSVQKIKPSVNVWWTSGAQSTQLLKDGEVDLMAVYSSRIAPLVDEGAPVAFTYQDGVLSLACMAIPKGAKNAAKASEMLAQIASPGVQKNIPTYLKYYGPANELALKQPGVPAEAATQSNTSPQNLALQAVMDPKWWGGNGVRAEERYRDVVAR